MDSGARALLLIFVLALCAGMAVVLLDKSYRPAKIAETNRGVFVNIPIDAPPASPDEVRSP